MVLILLSMFMDTGPFWLSRGHRDSLTLSSTGLSMTPPRPPWVGLVRKICYFTWGSLLKSSFPPTFSGSLSKLIHKAVFSRQEYFSYSRR